MYPENPEGTQVIVGSLNIRCIYISDTARNRTHNLFHPKREPTPLGHSDGQWQIVPHQQFNNFHLTNFCVNQIFKWVGEILKIENIFIEAIKNWKYSKLGIEWILLTLFFCEKYRL